MYLHVLLFPQKEIKFNFSLWGLQRVQPCAWFHFEHLASIISHWFLGGIAARILRFKRVADLTLTFFFPCQFDLCKLLVLSAGSPVILGSNVFY